MSLGVSWGYRSLAALSQAGTAKPQPRILLESSAESSTSAGQGNSLYNPGFPCRSSEAGGARGGWRRINFKSPLRHRILEVPGGSFTTQRLGMRKNSWQEEPPQSLPVLVVPGQSSTEGQEPPERVPGAQEGQEPPSK